MKLFLMVLLTAVITLNAADNKVSETGVKISQAYAVVQDHCKSQAGEYFEKCLSELDGNRNAIQVSDGVVIVVGHTVFHVANKAPNAVSREVLFTIQEGDLPTDVTASKDGFNITTQSGKCYEIREHGTWKVVSPSPAR